VASGILRGDGNGVFGPNSCRLAKDTVTDRRLNLLDLLNRLLCIEPIYEQINIGSRGKLLMVVRSGGVSNTR
jgi:hypothetical protein